jgi:transposase InsO family protein
MITHLERVLKLKQRCKRRLCVWPRPGRRMAIGASPPGYNGKIARSTVNRLLRDMGWQGQRPRRRPRIMPSDHAAPRDPNLVQGLTVVRPDQVWVGDMTSVR